MFSTEHEFTLPMGLLDDDGTLHRDGIMRLATASDEIEHPFVHEPYCTRCRSCRT